MQCNWKYHLQSLDIQKQTILNESKKKVKSHKEEESEVKWQLRWLQVQAS